MKDKTENGAKECLSRLEGMYKKVYSRPITVSVLSYLGYFLVAFVVLSFCYTLYLAYSVGTWDCVRLVAAAGVPFLFVSVIRRVLNFPRPYERYDFSQLGIENLKSKQGESFPSRHVFSAFLIGVLIFPYAPTLSLFNLVAGCAIAVFRVLLGVHFPRDVIVGAVIGVVSGALGMLIL